MLEKLTFSEFNRLHFGSFQIEDAFLVLRRTLFFSSEERKHVFGHNSALISAPDLSSAPSRASRRDLSDGDDENVRFGQITSVKTPKRPEIWGLPTKNICAHVSGRSKTSQIRQDVQESRRPGTAGSNMSLELTSNGASSRALEA